MTDQNCLFCNVPEEEKLWVSPLWFARLDKFPVTEGHTLLIPNRHVANVDELTPEEWTALRGHILQTVDGDFNIGINRGPLAGQTVFHVHVHVFPRKEGDIEGSPRGGVRNFKKPLVAYH